MMGDGAGAAAVRAETLAAAADGGSADFPAYVVACDCLTVFGDASDTVDALLRGEIALQPRPVLGRDGGDVVPLAVIGGSVDEVLPPRWLAPLRAFTKKIPAVSGGWGRARRPVVVTSSNFGVGSLYAYTRDHDARHLVHGPPFATVELLQRELDWGGDVTVFSHACVTAHLGLAHAARLLAADLADEVLVFSFDLVSPFVAGGFHSLKILNGTMPAPFAVREIGAIGLGDGAAFAVLRRDAGERGTGFWLEAHAFFNEMHHFTSNQPDAAGFLACATAIARVVGGRRVWLKGHGTGTLEAGRLEAETLARVFPGAPLVSWKGSLGHTLGSCGLVELALAIAAWRGIETHGGAIETAKGKIPATVGSVAPCFAPNVALAPLAGGEFDAAVLSSNAFGGAHAAMVLSRDNNNRLAQRPARRPGASRRVVRFIHHVGVERPPVSESAAEARDRLREKFPRAALRRMTHLGLLLGSALERVALTAEDAVVYATTYAETRALEDFLASFPAASPLLFQTSIHPGGIQQVLIGRQQPIARLWPLAGRVRIVEQSFLAALLEPAPRVVLAGGEERGTWLLEAATASERSFAFGVELTREASGALGRIWLESCTSVTPVTPAQPGHDVRSTTSPALPEFADALAERRPLAWANATGAFALEWR